MKTALLLLFGYLVSRSVLEARFLVNFDAFCNTWNDSLIVCDNLNYDEHSGEPEVTQHRLICQGCKLVFQASKIEVFPDNIFDTWIGISELKMSQCALKMIQNAENFRSTRTLIVLDLSRNYIQSLSGEIFRYLINLKTLDLSYNQVEDIAPDAFQGLDSLEVLNLKGNRIQKISRTLFMDLLELKEVDLSDNNINSFYDNIFAQNRNLKTVRLGSAFQDIRIDLKFLKDLEKLRILDLSRNSLQAFPVGAFSKMSALRHLNLSKALGGHSLSYGHFSYTKNLEVLDISNNLLSSVDTKIFAFLENLLALYMDRNKFQSIDLATLDYNTQLDVVSLSGNRWHCTFLASMLKTFYGRKITVDMSREELERDYANVEGIRCF